MPKSQDTLRAVPDQPKWFYIYALIDPFTDQIRYIGKTEMLGVRLRNHCNEKSRCHRTNWIQSVIRKGKRPVLKILARYFAWQDWKAAERMWIAFGMECGWPLTNGTYGGDGVEATPEVRAKISKALMGRKMSPAQRQKCIKHLKPKPHTVESKAKLRAAHLGKKKTPEHRRHVSEAKRRVTPDQVRDILNAIRSGEPQSSIAKRIGVSQPTISAVKNNHRKYAEESCS